MDTIIQWMTHYMHRMFRLQRESVVHHHFRQFGGREVGLGLSRPTTKLANSRVAQEIMVPVRPRVVVIFQPKYEAVSL